MQKDCQGACVPAELGKQIGQILDSMEQTIDDGSLLTNLRHIEVLQSQLELQPVRSMEDVLVKLWAVLETVDMVFNGEDQSEATRAKQQSFLRNIINDAIRFHEVESGVTLKSLGLEICEAKPVDAPSIYEKRGFVEL